MRKTILEVNGLKTYFYTEEGVVPAVDGLDFTLKEGETLAIVGESGCGKSVTSLSILRLIQSPPGKIEGGEILFNGEDLLKLSNDAMTKIRGNEISMIFQEPMTSLNPIFKIGKQLMDVFRIHQGMSKQEALKNAIRMLSMVGIPAPEKMVHNYPHQLSGGMRQRVMIAMALACQPAILIADEPTTALDVTIQAQIIRLLTDLKTRINTSIILITHDLGVVAQIAETVMVMYAGQAVEYADVKSIYKEPMHPYTKGLLKSVPNIHETTDRLYNIEGTVPSAKEYGVGCRFCSRCTMATERCKKEMPPLYVLGGTRKVWCFQYEKEAL